MNSENSSRFFSYAGSGGRTIKFDIATSKIGGVMALSLCICACCAACKISTCARVQKIVLPEMLPKSALCLFECRGGSGSKIFPLTVKLVPIHSGSVHVLAVTDQHLQLAVG